MNYFNVLVPVKSDFASEYVVILSFKKKFHGG